MKQKFGAQTTADEVLGGIADIDLSDPHFEKHPYDPWVAYGRSETASSLFAVEFNRRFRERGIRAASVMPGNSGATDLTRHLSPEEVQGLLDYVGKARADAGLRPAEFKDIAQAAATSVWAGFVADEDVIGGHYLEDCSVARIDNTPNPFADGVKSYALDVDRARLLWAASEELVNAVSTRRVGQVDV